MTSSDAVAKLSQLEKLYRELLRLKPRQTLSKSNQWLESISSGDDMQRTIVTAAIDCGCNVAFKISEDPDAMGAVFTKLPPDEPPSAFQKARLALLSLLRRGRSRG